MAVAQNAPDGEPKTSVCSSSQFAVVSVTLQLLVVPRLGAIMHWSSQQIELTGICYEEI